MKFRTRTRGALIFTVAIFSTGASANVLECRVSGALVGEATVNMNFETWHNEFGEQGDLEKVGPNKFRWRQGDGELQMEMTLSRNGRSATLVATGEGETARGSCKFLTTGRTPGQ